MLKVLMTVSVCFKYRESDEVVVTTHTRPTAVSATQIVLPSIDHTAVGCSNEDDFDEPAFEERHLNQLCK